MKLGAGLLLILSAFAAGFFLGRAKAETKETIKYVKGETTTGSVKTNLLDAKVELIKDIRYLPLPYWRIDTITMIAEVDTAEIIKDFMSRRDYEFTAFDNETGKLDVKQSIQFNQLQSFDYSFTPILKETTRIREPLLKPFISLSYNSANTVGIGGGIFIKDIGIEYKYLHNNVNGFRGHEIGLKFGL
jgi:hypothetical protein